MTTIIKQMSSMLNPVMTKFIQINTIFYSKSLAVYQPLHEVDPNSGIAHKIINKDGENPAHDEHLKRISEAKDLPNKYDDYKQEWKESGVEFD